MSEMKSMQSILPYSSIKTNKMPSNNLTHDLSIRTSLRTADLWICWSIRVGVFALMELTSSWTALEVKGEK